MAKTEEEQIADGRRIGAFLDDAEVKAVFARLEQKYISDMRDAQDTDAIVRIHAKFAVVSDVQRELRAVRDTGTVAQSERAQRERREAARPRNTR